MKGYKRVMGIDPGTNLLGYGVIDVVDGRVTLHTMRLIDLRKCEDPHLKL